MSYTVTEEAASAVRTVLSGLRAVRRRIWSILLQRAAVLLVNIALAAGLVLFLTERNVFLPAGWRIAILAVLAALLALLALWRVAWAARSYGTILKVAAAIDHRRPEFRNRLTSAVELSLVLKARGQYPGIYSGDLLEAALVQAAGLISRPSALRSLAGRVCAVNLKKLRLEYGLAAALAVLFLVSGLLDTRALSAVFHKYRNPLLVLEQERDFKITVRPGNVTLIRGDSLTVQGSGSIALPEPMRIHFRQAGKGTQNQTMLEAPGPGATDYSHTFRGLENDLDYYLEQGKAVTDTFRITVTNNPFLTELRLRYEFPDYTGLPPYETTRDRAIQALRGTRIVLSGRSSNVLRSSRLILNGDSLRQMTITGGRAFIDTITVSADGSYQIRLDDCWGLASLDTMVYPITVIPDEYPSIAIRFPNQETQIDESMQQELVFELADDFGVRAVRLFYHKESASGKAEDEHSSIIAGYRVPQPYQIDRYLWDLKPLALLPLESVVYRLAAIDNDNVSGPKTTPTPEFRIRFPSLQEIFEQQQQKQDQIAGQLEELENQGARLRQELEQMNEMLERGQQMDWEKGRGLDQAITSQQQMARRVEELSGELDQSVRRLDSEGLLSHELVVKLQQVQELMKEVATDEMKALMSKIQQAVESLDQKSLAESMEQFSFSQEKYMEKLDKTITLLKRLKLEQQMEYLVSRSGELARDTEALLDSSSIGSVACPVDSSKQQAGPVSPETCEGAEERRNREQQVPEEGREGVEADSAAVSPEPGQAPGIPDDSPRLPEQSAPDEVTDKLAVDAEKMEKTTAELFDRINETSAQMDQAGEKKLAGKLAHEGRSQALEELERMWREIAEKLRLGKLAAANEPQQLVSDKMQELHERMKKHQQELKQRWKQETAEAMERAFDELAYLSRRQEETATAVAAEPDINHPDALHWADEQQEILQGLGTVYEGLIEAARDNFFISPKLLIYLHLSIQRGNEAFEELAAEKRHKKKTVKETQNTLASINVCLLTLFDDTRKMQESASGMGLDQMLAQLEELAKRQEKLNQQMQGLSDMSMPGQDGEPIISPQGTRSPMPGDLMSLLRQMAAEQQAIREQMEELAKQMGGRKDLPGSSLEGMASEAEEVIKDLLKRGVSPETFKRQRRILDRLLDAQRSIQQRDTSRKRKSETAGQDYLDQLKPPPALTRRLLERRSSSNDLKERLERWRGSYPSSFEQMIRAYYEALNSKKIENSID